MAIQTSISKIGNTFIKNISYVIIGLEDMKAMGYGDLINLVTYINLSNV